MTMKDYFNESSIYKKILQWILLCFYAFLLSASKLAFSVKFCDFHFLPEFQYFFPFPYRVKTGDSRYR